MASKASTVYDDDVAGSAAAVVSVGVDGVDSLLVAWTIVDSGASGDIGATTVKPYTPTVAAAGVVIDNALPAVVVGAAARTDPVASKLDRYDVRGISRVQLSFTNNAVGTKNLVIHTYIEN